MPAEPDSITIYDAARGVWLLFKQPKAVVQVSELPDVLPALQDIDRLTFQDGHFAAGFLSYDAAPAFDRCYKVRYQKGFPLLWFGIYGSPQEVPPPEAGTASSRPRIKTHCETTPQDYRHSISRIRQHIANGETYQVNYTFRLRGAVPDDPRDIFARMVRAQGPGYGAYVAAGPWRICSASPELFFALEGGLLTSRPMKGTADRGLWSQDDLSRAAALKASSKNQAENLMIVDMVRNDMSRLADAKNVDVPRLFEIEQFPTVWQMTSTVTCRTRAGIKDIFQALFPPASITGAPKVSTMRIIAGLEDSPRRIYTGTVGFISPRRRAQFNVAIRTLAVDTITGQGEYGTGSGIVWDSSADAELSECRTKTKVLTDWDQDFSLLESLLWTPREGVFLQEQHLRRLKNTARYFQFPYDQARVQDALVSCASQLSGQDHKLRLLLAPDGTPTVSAHPVPNRTCPVRVGLAAQAVSSKNPFLYHKTTCRDVYNRARDANPQYDDVLLWNERGELTESTMANLIVDIKGHLYTPPLACGLLPGVYRAELLRSGQIREKVLPKDRIKMFDRIFLANSVRKTSAAVFG